MNVFVVTGLDLGWDCVVSVFDAAHISNEELLKEFPESGYVIHSLLVETDLSNFS